MDENGTKSKKGIKRPTSYMFDITSSKIALKETVMKIISWNCKNGFDKTKQDVIFSKFANVDIFVIQECRIKDVEELGYVESWHGDGKDSDLGIIVFSKEYKVAKADYFDRENRYVVPYNISDAKKPFVLYAVWTKSGYENYHVPVHKTLESLSSSTEKVIFIGDFNTGSMQGSANAHWYEKLKKGFKEKDIYNCANAQE